MSRIQDILAKAERDGTAGRTQALPPQPVATPPRVDGTSALEPFATVAVTGAVVNAASPAVVEPRGPVAAARSETVEARTATPTLHPLLVAAINPHSAVAEQYRSLRARISHREETRPARTMLVTSPGAGDGKSITAANLALTMAQEFQRRVVLVDGDFRGSAVHRLFGLERSPGLAEVLTGEAALEDALVYMPDYRLTVIAAGDAPAFPTELLGSAAMRRVLDTLRARFDRVLFDMPAVTPLADVGTLAPITDGLLMVVRAGATLRPALDEALAAFDEHKVLGVVLNETD